MWPYLVLFGLSFAAATVLPLSSEAALAALVIADRTLAVVILVATLGNVLGSATTFWLGRRAGAFADAHQPKLAARMERAAVTLRRWGPPALVLAWFPVAGDVLVAVAGAMRLAVLPCLAWITLGKAARYLVVGWAALAATAL
jgi:membrane protein YqaA with SNARE-associated domain